MGKKDATKDSQENANDDSTSQGEQEKNLDFPEIHDEKSDASNLSHDEKLKFIEKEVQTLYEFCMSKGFNERDVCSSLKPFSASPPEFVKHVFKSNRKFLFGVTLLVGIVAAFALWSPAHNVFVVHGKLALMQVLPYWDWTPIYNKDCFFDNPYYKSESNITKEDCAACLDLVKQEVEKLENVTHDVMANDFLMQDFPGIIVDGTKGWPRAELSLEYLSELYTSHKDLDAVGDCMFFTSIPKMESIYDFFNAYEDKKLPNKFYAAWENCDLKGAKVFRVFYKRPYYLPGMAESGKVNQIFVARGKLKEPFTISSSDEVSGSWMTILSGEITAILNPIGDCEKFGCKSKRVSVKKGQAIVVPHRTWDVQYLPASDGITVGLGSSVQWDDAM